MPRPTQVDDSPLSEFVTKMRDVFRRRLSAVHPRDQRALDAEMTQLMRAYLGRDAWEAVQAAERDVDAALTAAGVPRGTSRRRRVRPGPPSRYAGDDFDYKRAQAGDQDEER